MRKKGSNPQPPKGARRPAPAPARSEALKRAQRRHDAKRVTLRTSVRWPTQQAMDAALAKCRPGESLPALLKRLVDEYEPTNGT